MKLLTYMFILRVLQCFSPTPILLWLKHTSRISKTDSDKTLLPTTSVRQGLQIAVTLIDLTLPCFQLKQPEANTINQFYFKVICTLYLCLEKKNSSATL